MDLPVGISTLENTVVILADESANWEIAGLRQLDRLAFALNEFLGSERKTESPKIYIFWRPDISSEQRWVPRRRRLSGLEIKSDLNELMLESGPIDLVLSTRLFLTRTSFGHLLERARPTALREIGQTENEFWQGCFRACEEAFRSLPSTERDASEWKYIVNRKDISWCETLFLRGSGKSQDGLVSRFINRRVSRLVTRLLLKLPITPSGWTLVILVLPVAGAFALVRGDYWGFVIGMIVYEIYSVLDGCDGEIARAKYLESEAGSRLDNLCDHAGNLLMVVCLGIGLFRSQAIANPWRTFYLVEGIVAAILIAANEALLLASGCEANMKSNLLGGTLYPRHRALIRGSGILFLGEKFSWWLTQMTKRDVALFVFVILGIISRPPWILHLICAFALISLILASKAAISLRTKRNTFASSQAH
jgi:phosphatidylglycerophosphate synthase